MSRHRTTRCELYQRAITPRVMPVLFEMRRQALLESDPARIVDGKLSGKVVKYVGAKAVSSREFCVCEHTITVENDSRGY